MQLAACMCIFTLESWRREVIEYFANTLIFVISGVIIAGRIYAGHQDSSPHILTGVDYAWAVALWLLLLVSPSVVQDCRQEDSSV